MTPLLALIDRGLDRFARLTYRPYHRALARALAERGRLTIAVVGANDGKINDPVYGFAQRHAEHTEMVLIEPQADLLAPLKDHYQHHPRTDIIHGAVGSTSPLTLYTVDPDVWPQTQPFYAKAWPNYRAPSGIASTEKARVLAWIGRYLDNPAEHLVATEIEARPLSNWLAHVQRPARIDVLQVDTEGVDDQVIYQADLATTQPVVIYFESKNLSPAKLDALHAHLRQHGYRWRVILGNTLAERIEANSTPTPTPGRDGGAV
jgi:FkbM family methyltransferase